MTNDNWDDGSDFEAGPVVETVRSEKLLEMEYVASLLARPDLVKSLMPDARAIQDTTVRAVLQAWGAHAYDAAYSRPAALLSALDELPQEVDAQTANDILLLIPDGADVELGQLLKLKSDVDGRSRERRLKMKADRALALVGKRPGAMVSSELREALNEFDRGGLSKLDNTTAGQLDRLKTAEPKVRWKIGVGGAVCPSLDDALKGIGPDGLASSGMLGQGEVVVMAAGYGGSKTRLLDNWKRAILLQGGSVGHILLEDDDIAAMCKLMGIHADLPFWMVEQFARGERSFIGASGMETETKLNDVLDWYAKLGDRYRIYDGASCAANIFNFDEALAVMELDVRLYGTTHFLVDYAQAFEGGEEAEHASRYAQQLRAFAGRHKVSVVVLSQISNETLKWGSAPGQVAAKGSSSWGQIAHLGFELQYDPTVGVREIRMALKKARNMRRCDTYAQFNEETGRVLAYYDTPVYMPLPEAKTDNKKGTRK